MFSFKKDNKNGNKDSVVYNEEDLTKDIEIHVMPSKFIKSEDKSGGKKKALLIFGIFFILALFIIGAMLFIFKDNFFKDDKNEQQTAKKEEKQESGEDNLNYSKGENILTEEDKKSLQNIAQVESQKLEELEEEIISTSTPEIATSTEEIATSTPETYNIGTSTSQTLETSQSTSEISTSTFEIATSTAEISTSTNEIEEILDSDKDGLADAEEELFTSNKFDEDFDDDGYLDGVEVINLYNPIAYAPQELDQSGLVKIYNESRYNIFYPRIWETEIIEEGKVSFKAGNGEFIELLISPNPDSISLLDWYKIQIGMAEDVLPDFFENAKSGTNKSGLYYVKISDTTFYISDYNYIYVLSYNTGATDKINFPLIFEMMLQSLESKVDTDGDGITDYLEIDIYKTDHKKVDTDGDGYNDGEEILNNHDPLG
ncbi:MAG: hypothetical protein V1770_00200 [bacterium]